MIERMKQRIKERARLWWWWNVDPGAHSHREGFRAPGQHCHAYDNLDKVRRARRGA